MMPMQILTLVASAIVFLMWAISMFRIVFAMRKRAVARTGKSLPGPIDTLHEWGHWLRDPSFRQERRQLLLMTVCVMVLAYLFALTGGGGK